MAAALPTLTSRPEKTINSFLSKWNASELPIIYKIANTKFPTNSGDSTETVNSIDDNNGYARLTMSAATAFVAKDYVTIDAGVYQGTYLIRRIELGPLITLETPYVSNDSGTILKHYNNYTIRVEIYAGIHSTHPSTAEDPITLIGTVDQTPDSDNNTFVDIHKYIKSKLATTYQLSGNDLNAWKDFYIKYAEAYDEVSVGVVSESLSAYTTDESEWCHAAYSSLQFGNSRGGNMYDYLVAVTKIDTASFMTDFVRAKIYNLNDYSLSIIMNSGADLYGTVFTLELKAYDLNGVLLDSETSSIINSGYGVYRLDLDYDFITYATTTYITAQILFEGYAVSEVYSIDIDATCLTQPVPVFSWTSRTAADSVAWISVAYGNGVFVAVAASGSNVMRSTDNGATWSTAAQSENNDWNGIVYGGGVFIAVSSNGTNRTMWSNDLGLTWNSVAVDLNTWQDVAYGNGVFVAVANSGTDRTMWSDDLGLTWNAVTASEETFWTDIAYGNGVFVTVANGGTDRVMRSTDDGLTWSSITSAEQNSYNAVEYGNGVFVAVADSGTNRTMKSTDLGLTWVAVAAAKDNTWVDIAYGLDSFIAVSTSGTFRTMKSDNDGATWYPVAASSVSPWGNVAFGNDVFVAVAASGTDRVMTGELE